MPITYHTENGKMPSIKRRIVNQWIKSVAEIHGKKIGEIAYVFCSEEQILAVNKQYLQHDYYTDIITFDYSEGDILSGDIFVCPDTIMSNAGKFNTPYSEELHRILIHGILHLCGIDDKAPGEREIMEINENKALSMLPEEAYKNTKQR
ncbi:MAG: rRNA maturation RNase YbeY [Tannerellaceae bacterium]|jgi:rRNA maturation RNase YbeY|nr:rRNA maturation RNase YbeY [Tannerellaceae bacterium]